MSSTIVLYPIPAIGHLISMVELGKLILTTKPSLSIHILVATAPYNAGDTSSYIAAVSAAIPSITFHHLPPVSLPPHLSASSTHHETLIFELIRLNKPIVLQALRSISRNDTVHAVIMDFFCAETLTVPAQLNIPCFFFYTSPASSLAAFFYFPTLHRKSHQSFKDQNTLLDIPGLPPIPSSDMPKPILDRNEEAYQHFLDCISYFSESSGMIVNTFESLEPRAVKAISDGLCFPDGVTPPIHCIGPLIVTKERRGVVQPESLTWLDSQPSGSVVFLCFGSLGSFSAEQLREIAVGLERSGQRFLWVVRSPVNVAASGLPDPDLDSLLPGGFLERTRERGLVVKNWAPQVEVLKHDSVGGFVTHCGWNSVLEAVCAGVPMVAWPLYAEQRLNRVVLVEELKLALPMNESENGFVSANEVEKRVSELMDSESGDSLRRRALAMKNEAEAALKDGGSSRVALTKLTESWN
ncbi:UDP-glucuronosyl/UDP-glucosyltransferase [Trema orientale]|uniref:Glycosyltransferase n=1 Tax=Trema orientale TaxID=63057 RepID=A0A2P5FGN4_TREOI|nr:UDP-glucuronosyl/UDP-glucosyltransferase [Trema orientale]